MSPCAVMKMTGMGSAAVSLNGLGKRATAPAARTWMERGAALRGDED